MAKFVDIVTRLPKGAPLTYVEMDTNLTNLQHASNPIGTVLIYPSNVALPISWLECTGASLATATYADLYSIIGNLYGGDATNFNLPDLRGMFVRGLDNARGLDPNRQMGTTQEDEFKAHQHSAIHTNNITPTGGEAFGSFSSTDSPGSPDVPTQFAGGPETRPRNVALLYIIKASM